MSKTRIELAKAEKVAENVCEWLAPRCVRVEIAGSIRRRSPMVGDIEVVCVPRMIAQPGFFDDGTVRSVLDDAPFSELGRVLAGGSRMKKIALDTGIQLDLFIVQPPAQWGVQFLIRTGPAMFSKWMVTQRRKGGALPSFAHVRGGAVWNGETLISMPEESDYFEFCELLWITPERRRNQQLNIRGWGEHWNRVPA